MSNFAPISAGGSLKPADIEGHLLVVEPTEYVPEIATAMGTSDAIRVTVHDLTDQETSSNVLWFSKVLVSSLRSMIGQQVLAVMGKGTAKPGQSAPWMLHDASDNTDAVNAANDYLNTNPVAAEPDTVDPKEGLANALKGLPGATVAK
jgi:hypothetical protein